MHGFNPKIIPVAKDRSKIYEPHKDLNEFLLSKIENNQAKNYEEIQFEELEKPDEIRAEKKLNAKAISEEGADFLGGILYKNRI